MSEVMKMKATRSQQETWKNCDTCSANHQTREASGSPDNFWDLITPQAASRLSASHIPTTTRTPFALWFEIAWWSLELRYPAYNSRLPNFRGHGRNWRRMVWVSRVLGFGYSVAAFRV